MIEATKHGYPLANILCQGTGREVVADHLLWDGAAVTCDRCDATLFESTFRETPWGSPAAEDLADDGFSVLCVACLQDDAGSLADAPHEATCHGHPDEDGWCCVACCGAGRSLPGHYACTPQPGCGRWQEPVGEAEALRETRAQQEQEFLAQHEGEMLTLALAFHWNQPGYELHSWQVRLLPDGYECPPDGTYAELLNALHAWQDHAADAPVLQRSEAGQREDQYLIYLGTARDWCTLYVADSLPDFCAIQEAFPAVVIWDVDQVRYE